jgi:hypothetical protein
MMNEPDSVKIAELRLARAEAWKPFALAMLVVAVIAAVTVLLTGGFIGIAANTLVSVLCLLPLLILMAPLVVGVVLGNWALGRADGAAVRRLFGLEQRAAEINQQVRTVSHAAGERVIGLAVVVERLAPLWDMFDVNESKESDNVAHPENPDQPAGA